MNPVLIVGGGIAGLSTAIALARRGRQSVVLERAAEFAEFGAGLQISPNAGAVLEAYGLGEQLDVFAGHPSAIRVRTGGGRTFIRDLDLDNYCRRRHLTPYRVVHRADLIKILTASARQDPLIDLINGLEVTRIDGDGDGLGVITSDGTRHQARAVVAADGVWSPAGRKALQLSGPIAAGRSAWRATVPASEAKGFDRETIGLNMGPGNHFVTYPVRNGADINLVAVTRDQLHEETWNGAGDRKLLLDRFRDWAPPIRDIIERPREWRRWPLYFRRPEHYHPERPIVLLGDAWHATLPFMAQGAAMAIEDSAILADCLENDTDPLAAIKRFIALRVKRTDRLVRQAAENGRIYHMPAPISFGRDAVMRTLSSERLLARLDWIYRWKPDSAA